jgi:hypothetical protein
MSETVDDGVEGGGIEQRPATARAEETVDRAGERVGHLAVLLGYQLRVFAARAREEAEDIWAEARSMRRTDEQP